MVTKDMENVSEIVENYKVLRRYIKLLLFFIYISEKIRVKNKDKTKNIFINKKCVNLSNA